MKLLQFICLIINFIIVKSTENIQSTDISIADNPQSTEAPQTTAISTRASSQLVPTSQSHATTASTQPTSSIDSQSTNSFHSQPSSELSTSNPSQTSSISTNNQQITTQNPDIPTRNPQSPSRPWDCSKFRFTNLPQNCCLLPKLQMPQQITDNCKNECKNRHCCVVECKYREIGIYKNKEFNNQALLTAYKNSLSSEAEKMNWTNAMNLSLEFCESMVMSETTLRATTVNFKKSIVTMTTSRKAIIVTLKRTGQQTSTKSTTTESTTTKSSTTSGTTTSTIASSTESVKDRRDKNLYCHIPVYVYLMISCTKVQNFINCPNFKSTDEICEEWRDYLRKCGHELGFLI
ncbi:unnamed protein product [Chironomus riparius]|uniref:Uncharacterized protein n=1 Tax=Chironomus riparius TaxID=315576 RepID=A0A9N9X130_9DIPT|nr:unnamed protein product [Chironomus riparius]